MLSHADNEYLCRIGPGTPMGTLLRRFWMPALLATEVPEPDCPPVRLTLLSEKLDRSFKFRVSTHGLRSVEHNGGLDNWLLKTSDEKLSASARKVKRELKKAGEAA